MPSKQPIFQNEITCPHCWTEFPTEKILWISESPEMLGDSRLGQMEQMRFLPNAFDPQGMAIDIKGFTCKKLACPHCHLQIPRTFLEFAPFFISIVGAPSSGKSYFLSSMTWMLRKAFPRFFSLSFTDADTEMNTRLQEYEEQQFTNSNSDAYVKLIKTPLQGDLYDSVVIENMDFLYPKPFVFSLCPLNTHQNVSVADRVSLAVTLYDNAGESYLPSNKDNASIPVTRHLGISDCIFFLFDPIQDSRFRESCRRYTSDPQLKKQFENEFRWTPLRQEMILSEMINRIRLMRNLKSNQQCDVPVFVIVTKYDAWKAMLPVTLPRNPWGRMAGNPDRVFLLKDQIETASKLVRELFQKQIPEIVGSLEHFSSNVTYIPVSSTGGPPEKDPKTGNWGFQVNKINPFWSEVPLLYALANNRNGIVPMIAKNK